MAMHLAMILGAAWIGVGLAAAICARLTRPDRNYYPMQRVIWTALAFLGIGVGSAGVLGSGEVSPLINRIAFAVVMLAACVYSVIFMRRRNRTPRYLALSLGGHPLAVDQDHLRAQVNNVISLARHGAMPAAWIAEIEDATQEWHRMETWKHDTLAQARGRRFKREVQR